jgi:hypothetical protein
MDLPTRPTKITDGRAKSFGRSTRYAALPKAFVIWVTAVAETSRRWVYFSGVYGGRLYTPAVPQASQTKKTIPPRSSVIRTGALQKKQLPGGSVREREDGGFWFSDMVLDVLSEDPLRGWVPHWSRCQYPIYWPGYHAAIREVPTQNPTADSVVLPYSHASRTIFAALVDYVELM